MAARVNMKFVIGLGTALALTAGVVVWFGVQSLSRPGGQSLVTAGDEAMAAGKYELAASNYSKAVNKDQRNAEWIRKWMAALEKLRPEDRRSFEDAYFKQYLGAVRGQVMADRKNPAAFRRFLQERFDYVRNMSPNLKGWEAFLTEYEDTMKLYAGDEAGRKSLGRYRAMARAQVLANNPELAQAQVDEGLADANAALEVDPKDAEAVSAAVARAKVEVDRPWLEQLRPELTLPDEEEQRS